MTAVIAGVVILAAVDVVVGILAWRAGSHPAPDPDGD